MGEGKGETEKLIAYMYNSISRRCHKRFGIRWITEYYYKLNIIIFIMYAYTYSTLYLFLVSSLIFNEITRYVIHTLTHNKICHLTCIEIKSNLSKVVSDRKIGASGSIYKFKETNRYKANLVIKLFNIY